MFNNSVQVQDYKKHLLNTTTGGLYMDKYEKLDLEIVKFEAADIITNSQTEGSGSGGTSSYDDGGCWNLS